MSVFSKLIRSSSDFSDNGSQCDIETFSLSTCEFDLSYLLTKLN